MALYIQLKDSFEPCHEKTKFLPMSRSYCEADQRLFRYTDSTISLLLKLQARSVCV